MAIRNVRWALRMMPAIGALERGNPRRFRAMLRILHRRRAGTSSAIALHQAIGLFWEGAFDEAIAVLDTLMAESELAEVGPLAPALKVQCSSPKGPAKRDKSSSFTRTGCDRYISMAIPPPAEKHLMR
jgi:hypothetical protein